MRPAAPPRRSCFRRSRTAPLLLAIVALAALWSGCTSESPPPASLASPTATTTPTAKPPRPPQARYKAIACPFDAPLGRLVECGFLTVPEKRSDPEGRDIRLAVVVVKSDSPRPKPDPIVYLEGGPGGSTLEVAPFVFEGWFSPFVAERDVILFDQRGVGYSEPVLDCPEFNDAFVDAVERDVRRGALATLIVDALKSCHDRLARRGIDLSGYTSAESAADLNDLRLALGYEQWNLYGISYGTRLALTAMRDYPQGVRSVILDSSYPPQVDLYAELIPNAQRAFNELFEGCREDSDCNAAYPDLQAVLFDLAARLDKRPADLSVWNPATDVTIQAKMNGDLLIASLFQALYDTQAIPYLPGVIYSAHEGDVEQLTPLLGDLFFTHDVISMGMHYSVQCQEEVPFSSQARADAAAQSNSPVRYAFESEPVFTICRSWGSPQADPKENQPVRSDIPTLVLSGEYDPITPPAWGRLVAQDLSRGYLFEFPGVGHGASVSGEPCPLFITLAFLADPGVPPDAACIGEMTGPDFN